MTDCIFNKRFNLTWDGLVEENFRLKRFGCSKSRAPD